MEFDGGSFVYTVPKAGKFRVYYWLPDGSFQIEAIIPLSREDDERETNCDVFELLFNYCPDIAGAIWDAMITHHSEKYHGQDV